MARPHIEPYVELDSPYKKFNLGGFKGSHYKVLSLDTDTGACTLKVRFDGGYRRKPGLSYSDVEIFLLNGSMQVGKETWREGHYAFLPAGTALGAIRVAQGAEALVMYNDSEPTFVESDRHHPLVLGDAFVSMNSYEDAPWASGSVVSPSVATGCMIKLLRFDPITEAFSFLYCLAPRYGQDNISYHDCAEESYHIWGTSWMMQFGDLPTGGYFWRPPYINHGSFRCTYGTLAFGRTDSVLYNYFHYNPWTNPDENQLRAAAFQYRKRPQLYNWVASDGHNHPHGPPDFETPDYGDEAQVRLLHGQPVGGSPGRRRGKRR
ncbi:MAG: hypothetical protein AMXMBFR45_10610 [Gammaproteobacteria bacterium]|nr:MAG: DUF4437 domain-containing protein [Pseudomonadota bacterium]MBC6944522.1 DUF4437 domain-containing protein [Gammaproteobacteria bacterium]MCE7896513.1 DUF4437 domain-containing protein [Gammaproteobacteria bacterium PRO8]MDL1880956.1 DUF4437 domain-containing protein [Gammaproteobacteria bacterium PRO2]MCL4776510.1 DUF4437 domain-containing protein [Gammaproteobacteria bacterium]